jgi:hypothetical protein
MFQITSGSPLWRGHLHPKLETPGLTCPSAGNRSGASMVGGEHSSKEPIDQFVNSYSVHLNMSPRQSINFSVLFLGEQHCAPDVGAAAGPGPRPGEGDDGQDGHLVPLRQPDGAPHREQGRGDPHLLALR